MLGPDLYSAFPSTNIWWVRVQPKIGFFFFFAWGASWEKILTLDRLRKRGFSLANRCCFCQKEEETANHILLHCDSTKVLWNFLFSLFGVPWVNPFYVRDTLLGWRGSMMRKRWRSVWKAGLLCIFWAVWKDG